MPAFFILSGYLMGKNKGQKSTPIYVYIKRKLIKLMVPYLIFEGMATVLLVFVLRFKSLEQALIDTFSLKCNLGADWFLVTMFLHHVLFLLSQRLMIRDPRYC